MFRYDESETLARIPELVLVLTGDRDHLTLPEAGVHISKKVPFGEQEEGRHSGQLSLIEYREYVQRRVAEFAIKCVAPLRTTTEQATTAREVATARI